MNNVKQYLKTAYESMCRASLQKAAIEQGLGDLGVKLEKIVPDISNQYSTRKLDTNYLKIKVRNMHAFQISLVNKIIGEFNSPTIVDIGDSAGTHLQYIKGLHSKERDIKTLSVNLDPEAVNRIKAKGQKVLNARAEDLQSHHVSADIFLCFEILEHLTDPCRFLHKLSSGTDAKYLIVTVPFLRRSRVGLHHIKGARKDRITAENTHIFELCPAEWKLILKHSGWSIVDEKTYLQYPRRSFLRLLQPLWRRFDFEGFYGLILKRDDTWSSKYLDW